MICFHNATIVTMNDQLDIFDGHLLVQDNRIHQLLRLDEEAEYMAVRTANPEMEIIDCTGRVLLPGLIQTHIHLCQSLFRGQADDLPLLDWLKQKIWPLEAVHDEESIYVSAQLGIAEMLLSGTTAIVDMETVNYTHHAIQAIADSGIRALTGKVIMDRTSPDIPVPLHESTERALQESMDLYERWHGTANGRIQYAFNPRFALSCTDELMREVAKLSSEKGIRVHTHASENLDEIRIVEELYGMRNIEYFDSIGLTSDRLILAHCVWLDDNEIEMIKRSGVHVSHCPSSNMKLASGFAHIPRLLEEGVSVSLGADGCACNNHLDIFTEMRMAALIHKPTYGSTSMSAQDVLWMATRNGAKALGQEQDLGSLEVGKKADVVVLNLNQLHAYPSETVPIMSRIVYSAKSTDVETVMVDGRVVVRDRQLLSLPVNDILSNSNVHIRKMVDRSKVFEPKTTDMASP
ncbi:5'-deoxyadenosine deaminase [Brevibacillus dissolubilis]|uniref:5'-deoxyadenosine deaminase n=1 Tax=Brevibacillus dissolubilis TaxID=1844116 RepID=UPI001116CBF5|nr:5'-deoxyadenosine deaminase [Brevibacillus dissolubilis]